MNRVRAITAVQVCSTLAQDITCIRGLARREFREENCFQQVRNAGVGDPGIELNLGIADVELKCVLLSRSARYSHYVATGVISLPLEQVATQRVEKVSSADVW